MPRPRLAVLGAAAVVATALAACAAVLGVDGVDYGSPAEAGSEAAIEASPPAPDAGADGADGAADAPIACDAPACNPLACGAPAKDCLGGACLDGSCQPVELVPAVPGEHGVGIAVDEDYVYFTINDDAGMGALWRAAQDGGLVEPYVSSLPYAAKIAVDDAGVYVTAQALGVPLGGSVQMVRKGCTGPTCRRLIGNDSNPYGVAVFGGQVYWASNGGDQIVQAPTSGGSPALVGNVTAPIAVAVDSDGVFATGGAPDAGEVFRIVNTVVDSMGAGPRPYGILTDGSRIYWAEIANGAIFSAAKTDLVLVTFAQGQPSPVELDHDQTYIYWCGAGTPDGGFRDGVIARQKKSGCAPGCVETLARVAQPKDLAVDAKAIYWIDADARVVKLAK